MNTFFSPELAGLRKLLKWITIALAVEALVYHGLLPRSLVAAAWIFLAGRGLVRAWRRRFNRTVDERRSTVAEATQRVADLERAIVLLVWNVIIHEGIQPEIVEAQLRAVAADKRGGGYRRAAELTKAIIFKMENLDGVNAAVMDFCSRLRQLDRDEWRRMESSPPAQYVNALIPIDAGKLDDDGSAAA